MAKPEKRWQLLLVADDGRIIPLKRIKAIAVTLLILLVLLGLVCAGLAWQLTAEKVRHHRTRAQLAEADQLVVHYKGEHELIAAELVLTEARMEKAGLSTPQPRKQTPQHDSTQAADGQSVSGGSKDAVETSAPPAASMDSAVADPAATQAAPKPAVKVMLRPTPDEAPAASTPDPVQPVVELGDLEVKHDAGTQILWAQFRVKNTGPRSSPVEGRCVVVLKSEQMEPAAWLAMPDVNLVDGKPEGERGQAFRISRFKDMQIKARGQVDPSAFKTATVYVFDGSGAKILEKDFPVDLPAPRPAPPTASEKTPADKPPLTEPQAPEKKEDRRARF